MFSESIKIRLLLSAVLLCLSSVISAGESIQAVKDLGELKRQAESNNLPVLLLLTTDDCAYCEAIRKNYLIPMVESGDYSSTILFRELYIEDFSYLRNEEGELISGSSIALKYDVEVTPTILFINSRWEELSERIVGISSIDYFDKLLNTHIAQSTANMAKLK